MQFTKRILFLCCLLFLFFWRRIEAVIHSVGNVKSFGKNYNHYHSDFTINKVSFTQKGYIQFLRYFEDVPPLTDYTFCIWMRSNNLTYSHPLLSYSQHEEERLIRVWISPFGTDINLEILEHHIFKIPIKIVLNHWYHICQSWSSNQAAWNLYLNGKLLSSGFEPKLKDVVIKGHGDIVVGQEYTDFDKGLDDGIEGDVFGFNFVLSPTSNSLKYSINSIKPINRLPLRRRHFGVRDENKIQFPYHHKPTIINHPLKNFYHDDSYRTNYNFNNDKTKLIPLNEEIQSAPSYFSSTAIGRVPKGIIDFGTNILNNVFSYFEPAPIIKNGFNPNYDNFYNGKMPYFSPNRIINDVHEYNSKPTGLKLVELSYNCALGKGAPVHGKDVLISWTRTPVRVFGGAILKTVPPFCFT